MSFSRINRRDALKSGAGLLAVGFAASQRLAGAQSTPASGTPVAASGVKLTVYSGQHEDLTKAFADAFKTVSGIEIEVRAGSDSDLANQIVEEGDKTNADVFITEEPGPVGLLDARDLLAPIDPAALAKTDKRFNPENGHWLAYGARSRAIFYNPTLIEETALPKSILDLTDAGWKGKFGYAPSGAFVDTVTYLVNTIGEKATLDWLTGIEANGKNLLKNGAVRDAVEAGQIPFGLANHYYWYILARDKGGPDKLTSKVHFMGNKDAGALILASGAAIPKAGKKQDAAQQFIAWLADAKGGQAVLAQASPQYPLAPGVESSYGLKPLSELDPPLFDQGSLRDTTKASELIVEAGII